MEIARDAKNFAYGEQFFAVSFYNPINALFASFTVWHHNCICFCGMERASWAYHYLCEWDDKHRFFVKQVKQMALLG